MPTYAVHLVPPFPGYVTWELLAYHSIYTSILWLSTLISFNLEKS